MTYTMTAREIIEDAFYDERLYNTPKPITPEEAAVTITAWEGEGIQIPPTLTPALFARYWNILCEKA